jgi:hypothetical protein
MYKKEELEMILKALTEYEKNHYESESNKWQVKVNNLINKIEENKKCIK